MLDFMDIHGRPIKITKETYKSVLPKNIEDKWNNPDELYDLLFGAIKDGFFVEIEEAAKHLIEIDSNRERSICLYGILQMKLNNYTKAENIFLNYLKENPKSGYVLTNLSKVQHELGKTAMAMNTLEKGLKIDPNQENGLYLWIACKTKIMGIDPQPNYVDNLPALEEYNKNFGGWRIKVLIGSCYSHLKQKEIAIQWFKDALAENWNPDVLTDISGALGKNGFIEDVINLIEPLYIPETHQFLTGLNLLQTYLELNMVDKGIKLLDTLFGLNRPDKMFAKQQLLEYQCAFSKLPEAQNLSSNDGGAALILATTNKDIEAVDCLIKQGAAVDNTDDDGRTPLTLSTCDGNIGIVKRLIDAGADVNKSGKAGYSALIVAAAKGHVEVVNILLDCGANVDCVTTNGWTALMGASLGNYLDVVDKLLDKGADPNIEAENGATALICASQFGHIGILKKPLARGVDKNKKNKLGQTALDVAISCNNKECMQILS